MCIRDRRKPRVPVGGLRKDLVLEAAVRLHYRNQRVRVPLDGREDTSELLSGHVSLAQLRLLPPPVRVAVAVVD
eukprot:2067171-Lingulodinium_polyedra.AAC.1